MIYYSIPYNSNKNIGVYYNNFMSILPNDNDWACFLDGDAVFTTTNFGNQLEDIISKYLDAGVFVGVTNRIGCTWQKVDIIDDTINTMDYHREIGKIIQNKYYDLCEDVTFKDDNLLSGVLFLIKKEVWKKIGGFKETGMLAIDNDLHLKCRNNNIKVYKMEGVYVYHWYRNNNRKNIEHLI